MLMQIKCKIRKKNCSKKTCIEQKLLKFGEELKLMNTKKTEKIHKYKLKKIRGSNMKNKRMKFGLGKIRGTKAKIAT